jgi:hypothetical protein
VTQYIQWVISIPGLAQRSFRGLEGSTDTPPAHRKNGRLWGRLSRGHISFNMVKITEFPEEFYGVRYYQLDLFEELKDMRQTALNEN